MQDFSVYVRGLLLVSAALTTACQSPAAPSRDLTALQQGTEVHLSVDLVVDSADQIHWLRAGDTLAAGLVLTPEEAGRLYGAVRYDGPALGPDTTAQLARLDDSNFRYSTPGTLLDVYVVARTDSTLDLLHMQLQPSDNQLSYWALFHSRSGGMLEIMAVGHGTFR